MQNKGVNMERPEYKAQLDVACEKFRKLMAEQLIRVENMKAQGDFVDYAALDVIKIGVCGGDGIGPIISAQARRVLEFILADLVEAGKVEFKDIEGLTIENRIAKGKAIPDDVMAELKSCHVILKGPTTTPQKGSGMPNIESANVAMRKALDLFANIRPVKVPEEGINWTIFRENTEGGYAIGASGYNITEDLAVDFTVTTKQGSDRIARLAYDYARKNGFTRVSLVTKANVIKTTDGNFLEDCHKVGDLYPEITTDEWYADIMTAKLVDQKRRKDFQVLLLPNLYGDIISDEAAEFQGGVGTAGCANIGKKYAMFEAIHGSAPRMISEGRGEYADPCSMLRACVMLLSHIGLQDRADKLERALDICSFEEKKLVITGRNTGATCQQFGDYVMQTLSAL
jgi:isocitrate dehydrogenase (NAD+)